MHRSLVFVLSVCLLAVASDQASARLSRELEDSVKAFNTELRASRPKDELLPLGYVELAGRSYAYYVPARLARLARLGATFRISDVRYGDTYVQIQLVSGQRARVSLFVFDDRKDGQEFLDVVVPLVLRQTFAFGEPPIGSRYVGNAASKLLHLRGCNHLPPDDQRQDFMDRAAATAAGFRPCTICFATEQALPIEGYAARRLEALETARLREIAFPPLADRLLQERLQASGEAALSTFPVVLQGFDYVFKVLHSEWPNAFTVPTGFVYVTDALFSAVEDSLELRYILAHEIAHCEVDREVLLERVFDPLLQRAAEARYFERLRFREVEADLLALLTLAPQADWAKVMRHARAGLSKMQMVAGEFPTESDTWSTHPAVVKRLAMFDPERFEFGGTEVRFRGVSKSGEVLARARFLGRQLMETTATAESEVGGGYAQGRDGQYYVLIEASDLLNERIEGGWGVLKDGQGHVVRMENRAFPFPVAPGHYGVVSFQAGWARDFDVHSLQKVNFAICGQIDRWELDDASPSR